MKIVKKILMVLGVVLILGLLFIKVTLSEFDDGTFEAYSTMAKKVIATGDPAKGMVIRRKMIIPDGMTKEEAIENAIELMDEVADEHSLAVVDNKIMSRKPYIQIRSYCSPSIGKKFITYSPEFIGFMPCRIGIAEDKKGDLYLYTMSLDMMIHGGKKLPKEMLELANDVREGMYGMLEKGAEGE